MSPNELVETALRVLVAWTHGCNPASADLDILKKVFPSSANLPDDELACQVIHDLSGRAFRKPAPRDEPGGMPRQGRAGQSGPGAHRS
jgi:hypothetical protein